MNHTHTHRTGIFSKISAAVKDAFDEAQFTSEFLTSVCKIIATNQPQGVASAGGNGAEAFFARWGQLRTVYIPPKSINFSRTNMTPAQLLRLGWVVPCLADLSCSRRVFCAVSTHVKRGSKTNYSSTVHTKVTSDSDSDSNITIKVDDQSVSALSFVPLSPLGLSHYLTDTSCISPVPRPIPQPDRQTAQDTFCKAFAVDKHAVSQTQNAKSTIGRLSADLALYVAMTKSDVPAQLRGFLEADICAYIAEPGGDGIKKAISHVNGLIKGLTNMHVDDTQKACDMIDAVLAIANHVGYVGTTSADNKGVGGGVHNHDNLSDDDFSDAIGHDDATSPHPHSDSDTDTDKISYALSQSCGRAPVAWFEHLVGLMLDSDFERSLCSMNPYLSKTHARTCLDLLSGCLFTINRIGHVSRSINTAVDLYNILVKVYGAKNMAPMNNAMSIAPGTASANNNNENKANVPQSALASSAAPTESPFFLPLKLKAKALAQSLATRRHYVTMRNAAGGEGFGAEYDPRFLVFEFACNLVLRDAQVCMYVRTYVCICRCAYVCA